MQGLPVGIDLSALEGTVLSQVCVSTFQCILNFTEDVRIAIESGCVHTAASGAVTSLTSYSAAASLLCALIGVAVQSASRQEDGGLVLRFENGATLQLLNDCREYESFQVELHKTVFVA